MDKRFLTSLYWIGLWTILVAISLFARPPLPVDETRYLAVAWDMWLRNDFLVPYLNGETYSHKPPLLFWLMHLGWAGFGVNDITPRLVAPLFGLASLFLTRSLARDLWPEERSVHDMAPILLLGFGFWALFSTLTMFDLMLAFCTLLGLKGVLMAWRREGISGFIVLAVAIGLGALTKGPAILVHLLPVTFLAPMWAGHLCGDKIDPQGGWWQWYLGLLLSICVGIAIGLAWAIPAGDAGGEAYRNAILWGQTAGRMVKSFAHQRPFWWYLAVLPGLLMPWLIWPSIWRSIHVLRKYIRNDGGVRLCLIWFVAAFVVFSMISGKQLHYLLPEFPAAALLMAFGLSKLEWSGVGIWDKYLPGIMTVIIGLVVYLIPELEVIPDPPYWLPLLDHNWGLMVCAAGAWLMLGQVDAPYDRVNRIVLASIALIVTVHLAAAPVLNAAYDLRPLALQLKTWEDEGIVLANFGKYHGQYQFLGRLTKPMKIMGLKQGDEEAFLSNHPNGRIIAYYKNVPSVAKPVMTVRFRKGTIVVWEAKTMAAHPHLGDRR